MTMTTIKRTLLAATLFALPLTWSPSAKAQDITVDIHGALNLSTYTGTSVSSGMGSLFGAHGIYFFHKSLGVFTGLDRLSRPMSLNASDSTGWIEIPVGLMFRGNPGDLNLVGLGVTVNLPTSDFVDSTKTFETNGGMSLILVTNRYYSINSNLSLGIYSDIRYSFHSPLADASEADARVFSFDVGLGARVNL